MTLLVFILWQLLIAWLGFIIFNRLNLLFIAFVIQILRIIYERGCLILLIFSFSTIFRLLIMDLLLNPTPILNRFIAIQWLKLCYFPAFCLLPHFQIQSNKLTIQEQVLSISSIRLVFHTLSSLIQRNVSFPKLASIS